MRSSIIRVCNSVQTIAVAVRAVSTAGAQVSEGVNKAGSTDGKRRLVDVKNEIRSLELQRKQDLRARANAIATSKKEAVARKKLLAKQRRERSLEAKARDAIKARAKKAKLIEKPWLVKGSLPTSPPLLYVSEKMKTYQRPPGESGLAAVHKLRKEFLALSPEQKAPYEARAAANRAMREDAKKKVRGIGIGPYSLFMKEQYPSVSGSIEGKDGVKKMPLIAKEVSRRWKALTDEQKATYKKKADAIKTEAKANLSELTKAA